MKVVVKNKWEKEKVELALNHAYHVLGKEADTITHPETKGQAHTFTTLIQLLSSRVEVEE